MSIVARVLNRLGYTRFYEPAQIVSTMKAEVKPRYLHQTPADVLDWLCDKYKLVYRIQRPNDGIVIVLDTPEGITMCVSGLKPTVGEAVAALYSILEGKPL